MQLYMDEAPEMERATYESTRQSGFVENWQSALGLSMTEDLPITSQIIPAVTQSQRDKKLYDYIEAGTISQDVANFYGSDADGLAYYAENTLGLKDIPSGHKYEKLRDEEYENYREYSEGIKAKQSKLGWIGEQAGYMHAMATDPLYAVSFLTGYGSAKTVLQASLRVGLIESGIELAAQPGKMTWREQIGADASASRALTEVIFTGLGAGTLAGISKGVGKGIEHILTPKDLRVKDGIVFLESKVKDNPEIEPVLHSLKQHDPDAPLQKTMQMDESIDIDHANFGPAKNGLDTSADINVKEHDTKIEESFYERTGDKVEPKMEGKTEPKQSKEGVTHVTPKKDLNPIDQEVYKLDNDIKIIEECF